MLEHEQLRDDHFAAKSFGTRAIHVGQAPDATTGAVVPALNLATTYQQTAAGEHRGFEYSRTDNPTRRNFEQAVASLEHAKYGIAFASGSAVTAAILTMFTESGAHFVSVNDVYGGTYRYMTKVAPHLGAQTTFVDLEDPEALRDVLQPNTKLVWIETPTNPTLRLVDIEAVARIAHEHGAMLVVDNTFLSPFFQNPILLGADMVVHSVSKYINGHSDVIMGIVVTNHAEVDDRLRFIQNATGSIPSPFDCHMAHRGLKTLHVRMPAHERNAMAVATALEASPFVQRVIYPGLSSHPQHELAKKQQSGFGGMVTFDIKGDLRHANKFLQSTRLFILAESLGGVESLAELPVVMTHGAVSKEDRDKLGITETLIRLSVGIEDTDDLVADVLHALKVAHSSVPSTTTDSEAVHEAHA